MEPPLSIGTLWGASLIPRMPNTLHNIVFPRKEASGDERAQRQQHAPKRNEDRSPRGYSGAVRPAPRRVRSDGRLRGPPNAHLFRNTRHARGIGPDRDGHRVEHRKALVLVVDWRDALAGEGRAAGMVGKIFAISRRVGCEVVVKSTLLLPRNAAAVRITGT